MKCIRCDVEMKQYKINSYFGILGKEHRKNGIVIQTPYDPKSVYICEKCGYMEFSTNECEESDI